MSTFSVEQAVPSSSNPIHPSPIPPAWHPASRESIRGESCGLESLDMQARLLAGACRTAPHSRTEGPLLQQLARNGRLLVDAYRRIAEATARNQTLTSRRGMAAGQFLHRRGGAARGPARSAARLLPETAETSRQLAGRVSARVRPGAGADRAHGQQPRRRPYHTLRAGLPDRRPPDHRRTVGGADHVAPGSAGEPVPAFRAHAPGVGRAATRGGLGRTAGARGRRRTRRPAAWLDEHADPAERCLRRPRAPGAAPGRSAGGPRTGRGLSVRAPAGCQRHRPPRKPAASRQSGFGRQLHDQPALAVGPGLECLLRAHQSGRAAVAAGSRRRLRAAGFRHARSLSAGRREVGARLGRAGSRGGAARVAMRGERSRVNAPRPPQSRRLLPHWSGQGRLSGGPGLSTEHRRMSARCRPPASAHRVLRFDRRPYDPVPRGALAPRRNRRGGSQSLAGGTRHPGRAACR